MRGRGLVGVLTALVVVALTVDAGAGTTVVGPASPDAPSSGVGDGRTVPLADLAVTIAIASSNPVVGASVAFTAVATGGDPPYGYAWAFDDGTVANIRAPSHVFEAAGDYNVSVTVNDAGSGVVVQNRTVVVASAPTGGSSGLGATAYWIGGLVVLGVAALVVPLLWHRPAPPTPPAGATGGVPPRKKPVAPPTPRTPSAPPRRP